MSGLELKLKKLHPNFNDRQIDYLATNIKTYMKSNDQMGKGLYQNLVNKATKMYNRYINKKQLNTIKDGEIHQVLLLPDGSLQPAKYSGPGSDTLGRIKQDIKQGKKLFELEGLTPTDTTAQAHDLRYYLANNVDDVRNADNRMINVLSDIEKSGRDNKFNTTVSKIIQAKTILEEKGYLAKDKFITNEKRDPEDEKLAQDVLAHLEMKGYGQWGGAVKASDIERLIRIAKFNNKQFSSEYRNMIKNNPNYHPGNTDNKLDFQYINYLVGELKKNPNANVMSQNEFEGNNDDEEKKAPDVREDTYENYRRRRSFTEDDLFKEYTGYTRTEMEEMEREAEEKERERERMRAYEDSRTEEDIEEERKGREFLKQMGYGKKTDPTNISIKTEIQEKARQDKYKEKRGKPETLKDLEKQYKREHEAYMRYKARMENEPGNELEEIEENIKQIDKNINESKKSQEGKGKKQGQSKWVEHIKATQKKLGISYSQAMKEASKTYKK